MLWIPCLITNRNLGEITKVEQEMIDSERAMCLQYTLDEGGHSAYTALVKEFTEEFFGQSHCDGEIKAAFSQKVEQRKMGVVAGLHGSLTWSGVRSQPEEKLSFLLLQTEVVEGIEELPRETAKVSEETQHQRTEENPFPNKKYLKIYVQIIS